MIVVKPAISIPRVSPPKPENRSTATRSSCRKRRRLVAGRCVAVRAFCFFDVVDIRLRPFGGCGVPGLAAAPGARAHGRRPARGGGGHAAVLLESGLARWISE